MPQGPARQEPQAAAAQLEREGQYDEARQYDFFPVTFVLPREYAMFVEEFKRSGGVWIMKPIGSAQGKGIFLFRGCRRSRSGAPTTAKSGRGGEKDKEAKPEAEAYIVQRYIANPYLIGGKKFDLRLYVLVTSYSPLAVWTYRGGFAALLALALQRRAVGHREHVHAPDQRRDPEDGRQLRRALGRQVGPALAQAAHDGPVRASRRSTAASGTSR